MPSSGTEWSNNNKIYKNLLTSNLSKYILGSLELNVGIITPKDLSVMSDVYVCIHRRHCTKIKLRNAESTFQCAFKIKD